MSRRGASSLRGGSARRLPEEKAPETARPEEAAKKPISRRGALSLRGGTYKAPAAVPEVKPEDKKVEETIIAEKRIETKDPEQPSSSRQLVSLPTPAGDSEGYEDFSDWRKRTQEENALASELDALRISVKKIFKSDPVLCDRKPAGKRGRPIELVSNLFEVALPHGLVHHYDVSVVQLRMYRDQKTGENVPKKHRCASTLMNRKVLEVFLATHARLLGDFLMAYDGRANAYSRRELPKGKSVFEVNVKNGEDIENFVVVFTHVGTVSFDALHGMYAKKSSPDFFQTVLQAADIIMKSGPIMAYVPIGNSLYQSTGKYPPVDLTGGLEAWFGFYATLRLGQWKPLLNVDMSSTGFFKSIGLIDFACELFNCREDYLLNELNEKDRKRLISSLSGLKVFHKHFRPDRKHRIDIISRKSAARETFKCGEEEVTVREYFYKKYQIDLKYPQLPCVVDKKGAMVPLELCILCEGQASRKKLTEEQTRRMIKQAALDPTNRMSRIRESFASLQSVAQPYLNEFDMKLNGRNVIVEARVLPSPVVTYKDKQPVRTSDGVWRATKFLRGESIKAWGVVVHGRNNRVDNMVHLLISEGQKMGMDISRPLFVDDYDSRMDEKEILQNVKKRHPNIEIVVFCLGVTTQYARIKKEAETTDLCMRTQCVKSFNVEKKFNPMFAGNLLQKINAKMGGINNGLLNSEKPDILKQPFMVIGMDVSHASPGSEDPSVAAMVASMDSTPATYHTVTSVNTARGEYIKDTKDMLIECLQEFQERAKTLPQSLIFYRDGVSETQFEKIRLYELCAIREACLTVSPDYTPPITFIVVQKRHHVRFIPKDSREGTGRAKNIPAGTIVDTEVVSPACFDFYLCSHQGIQGTSRPSRYHVVHDDNSMSPDDVYSMTYLFCHVYSRCTRSVSIPAPCYYAHLAAFRARDYMKAAPEGSLSSGKGGFRLDFFKEATSVNAEMKKRLYFV